jgi:hypothetical protein
MLQHDQFSAGIGVLGGWWLMRNAHYKAP